MPTINRRALIDLLDSRLSVDDVRDIVFDLGLDWGNLGGDTTTKRHRLQNIIDLYTRRQQIDDFLAAVAHRRPDVLAPGTTLAGPSAPATTTTPAPDVNVSALIERGHTYVKANLPDRAIEMFTTALKADPTHVPAYLGRGQAYIAAGQAKRAIEDFTEAILLEPDNAEAYERRGRVYFYGQKDTYRGRADFDKAIEADPARIGAYAARAEVHQSLKAFDRAIADFSQAIKLAPPDSISIYYSSRASLYEEVGDLSSALADRSMTTIYDPQDAHYRIMRGKLYQRQGNYQAAIGDFSTAIQLGPGKAWPYFERAECYKAQGDRWKAMADYRICVQLADDSYRVSAEFELERLSGR